MVSPSPTLGTFKFFIRPSSNLNYRWSTVPIIPLRSDSSLPDFLPVGFSATNNILTTIYKVRTYLGPVHNILLY